MNVKTDYGSVYLNLYEEKNRKRQREGKKLMFCSCTCSIKMLKEWNEMNLIDRRYIYNV